jgi:hypothetical protein
MPRNLTTLALTALIAVLIATVAALAGNDTTRRGSTSGRVARDADEPRPDQTTGSSPDPVVDIARRYALAARNWAPASYEESLDRQIQLAAGRYRRELVAAWPGRRELLALGEDHARSAARVIRAERDPGVRPPAARVLVTLNETTSAAGQVIRGTTVNEVRLRRYRNHWRVVGWTVLPGA